LVSTTVESQNTILNVEEKKPDDFTEVGKCSPSFGGVVGGEKCGVRIAECGIQEQFSSRMRREPILAEQRLARQRLGVRAVLCRFLLEPQQGSDRGN
jgi:hypothetical protein